MNRIIKPARIVAPPALATEMTMILFFVNVGADPAFSADASEEVVAALVSEALTGDMVDVASVVGGGVCELLLLELLELLDVVEVVVDCGAKSIILGIVVWMTTFAVIVRCVFGKASFFPLHILNAVAATASIPH